MDADRMLVFASVLLGSGLVASVPLLLAALGESFSERAGLLNLGVEGMMLMGAFVGFLAALSTESIYFGLASGLLTGILMGFMFGLTTITLHVDQIIIGLGTTVFASGTTGFLFRELYGRRFPSLSASMPKVAIPLLSEIPVIGPAFFKQQLIVYATWVIVLLMAFVLDRTSLGLRIRAVGESPLAADAAGVNVARVRYYAILIGGGLAGLGGAFLAVGDLSFFVPGMTVGQGFIAIAIAMLGKWRPRRVFVGALLFGIFRSVANGLQILHINIRPELTLMLPYLGIIVALVVLAGRTTLPAALGVPYRRGEQ